MMSIIFETVVVVIVCAISAYHLSNVVSSNPAHVLDITLCDKVGGFRRVHWFPPSIKRTTTI